MPMISNRRNAELVAAEAAWRASADKLAELISYVSSDKFAGPDADYIHIRTDLLPKLLAIRSAMIADLYL